jgi:hypothetical protein
MSVWLRLSLAIALGVSAAALNYLAVANQAKPQTFQVAVARADLPVGHAIGAADLGPVSIEGRLATVRQVLVPWEERAILFGRPIARALRGGDAILWRDMDPPDAKFNLQAGETALQLPFRDIAFDSRDMAVGQPFGLLVAKPDTGETEPVGPFRLLRRLNQGDSVMTIAARKVSDTEWDATTAKLLKALAKGARIEGVYFITPPKGAPPP